jgi:putative membrane-bound dehydrogenase-like protein
MKRRLMLTSLLATGVLAVGAGPASQLAGQSGAPVAPSSLQAPPGFEVTIVAAAPLVHHPTLVGLDDRGRLFVSENAGVNLAKAALDEQLPSAIRMLEDTNGDGVFDRSTVFADRLTFPQGGLWHDGALFAGSPPSLWRFDDENGDGVAERRRAIATGFDYTGNAADIHGPFLSPTGRLFWCHGRKGHEVYDGGRLVSRGSGARIWSSRPDGTGVEPYAGGGMDNPTEVAFSDEGDIFGTVNLFHGTPRADAIVHWMYGGAYPRTDQEQVLAEFKRTGELLTPAVNLGHVAPAGIMRYRSRELGETYQHNLFHAEFNTHRIMRTILEPQGSTFTGRSEVFVASSDPDVHFTDVLEDADGSLLVVNTGGWFSNGCPTSGLGKPEVHGTIYRVRRRGAHRVADPRGQTVNWREAAPADLTARLADPRFVVRDRAVETLGRAGEAAVPALSQAIGHADRQARLQAIWALTRIETPAARAVVHRAFVDADAGVRRAAARSAFTTRDAGAASELRRLLADADPAVRRDAAAALGRIDAREAVAALLDALNAPDLDRTLEHALIYALIEIDEPAATAAGLTRPQPAVRRGALLALDQMPSDPLAPATVLPLLDATHPPLRDAALMIVARRRAWSAAMAADLTRRLALPHLPAGQHAIVRELVMRFGREDGVRVLVGEALARPDLSPDARRLLLTALAETAGIEVHASWIAPLTSALTSSDPDLTALAIRVVRAARASGFEEALTTIGADASRDPIVRIAALQAVRSAAPDARGNRGRGGGTPPMDEASFSLALDLVDGASVPVRVEAAEMLARSALTAPQLLALARRIETAGPMELRALTPALGRSRDREVGLALVEALGRSPGLAALTEGDIRRSFRNYPGDVVTASARLVQQLLDRDRHKAARLAEMAAVLDEGDPARGRQLFAAGKGSCVLCHRAAGTGGQVGPDLSAIGRIRGGPELLDAILYPSDNLARGYETYALTTTDGRSLVGTIQRETPDSVELTPAAGPPVALARDQIRSRTPSPASLMPPGLEALLTRQELGDLIAWLSSLK